MSLMSFSNHRRLADLLQAMVTAALEVGYEQHPEWPFSCSYLFERSKLEGYMGEATVILKLLESNAEYNYELNGDRLFFQLKIEGGRVVYWVDGVDAHQYPRTVRRFRELFQDPAYQIQV